jgi:hypothetical protein
VSFCAVTFLVCDSLISIGMLSGTFNTGFRNTCENDRIPLFLIRAKGSARPLECRSLHINANVIQV